MTEIAVNQSHPLKSAAPGRSLTVALWIVRGLLAVAFAGAGVAKLTARPEMVSLYDTIGVGQWFRDFTGLLELSGTVAVLVTRTRAIAAGLLMSVMVGAIATHVLVLHNSPAVPVVLLALATAVLWSYRAELRTLLRRG